MKKTEMIQFPFFYNDSILNIPIHELDLSVRAMNGLKRQGISTIGQIIENWNCLKDIKHFGSKCIRETKSAIFNYNVERLSKEQTLKFLETFRYYET